MIKLTTITFLLLLIPQIGQSQQRILTLQDVMEIALDNNREIRMARMEVQKSRAAVREAYGYAMPSVDINANFSRFLEKPRMAFPDFEALLGNATYAILFDEGVLPRDESKFRPVTTRLQSFVQSNNYESGVQVTQPLFNASILRGIGAAKIYQSLFQEEEKRVTIHTLLEVKRAFYGVLLGKEMYEISKASFENGEENLRNVRVAFEQGIVSEFDLLHAEVQLENIRPFLLQSENSLKSAKDGLKLLLGIPQEEDIEVAGDFSYNRSEIPDPDETVEIALFENYTIRTLRLRKDVDRAFVDYYRTEYWPTIYAFGNYNYAGSDDRFDFQNYSSSIIGITFSFNIFTGGQTRQRVQQAKVTLRQTEQLLFQYEDYIALQIRAKINDLLRAKSILDAQERNVNLAERAYDIAVVRYKEGTGGQLEVQNADVALRQARTNRLQSVYDYIIVRAELDLLTGRTDFANI